MTAGQTHQIKFPTVEDSFRLCAILCGASALAFGLFGLACWLAGRPEWTVWGQGWPVAPRVACFMVVAASALLTHLAFPAAAWGRACVRTGCLLVLLLLLWSLLELLGAFRLGMESRLFAPATGFDGDLVYQVPRLVLACLALVAASLVAMAWGRGRVADLVVVASGLVVLMTASVVLLGHPYRAGILFESQHRPVSVFGALALAWAGAGLLATAGPRTPPLSVFVGPGITPRLLRAVVPAVLGAVLVAELLPDFVLTGFIRRAGIMGVVHVILPLGTAAAVGVFVVRRVGRLLEQSEAELKEARDLLELRVAERTTELTQANAHLREGEQRFRAIFESAPAGIALYGAEGRFLQVNRAYAEMVGRSEIELLDLGVMDVTHPDDVAEGRQLLGEVIAGRREGYAREKRFLRKDGHLVVARVAVAGVRTPGGALRFIVSTALDLTEPRRMQRELLQISTHERRQFSYDLHDGLGQYLSGLSLKAKCLEEDLLSAGSPQAAGAAEIVRWINRASAQARAMGRGLDPVQVEVGGLVPALDNLAQESEKLLSIPCHFRCNVPEVKLAPEIGMHLFRIAQEAIHNAAKHAQARRVDLDLTVDAEGLRLCVKDDGTGLAPDRANADGMGLRTMRFRADSIGGTLAIESQPNLGVQVTCLVPAARFFNHHPTKEVNS